MIICNCTLHLDLYDVSSLKGRRSVLNPEAEPAGGAVVVIDVHQGEILVAASAPRTRA